jgi:hypothetical protein
MADKLTQSELDSMKKSLDLMTDLSKNLSVILKNINYQTDLAGKSFKDIIAAAQKNNNLAEKYLISQKASEVVIAKINELKSKSNYLDETSLSFKKQEILLQNRIARENISLIQSAINSGKIDVTEGRKRIESLKMQRLERGGELKVLNQLNGVQNKAIKDLQQTLGIIDGFSPSLQRSVGYLSKFSDYFGETNTTRVVSDLGKIGEYLKNGLPSAKEFFVYIIEKGYENFKLFDKAAVSVRSHLGAMPGEVKKLESLIRSVGIDSMHLGATFEDVSKSIIAISDDFTSLVTQDKNLLTTTTALSKQFGVSEAISSKFLKTLGGISGESVSSQRSMTGFAQKMAQASGVPLGKIMNDVADASDDVRVYVGSSAVSMIKAAAAARMMGIDLNKAASSAEKLLNFESSINSELKASALLGQNVNFNYARQLSFNKDIIGANKEILRITKQVNFNQLNPIQQKAYADAAGKTVSELQDMLTQEKNMQLVANSTNKDVQKRYREYQRLMELKEQDAKNEGKLAEQEFLRKANQEKLAQLQNKFNQLMSEIAEPVMEIVDAFLTVANAALPIIVKGLMPISGSVLAISNVIRFSVILIKNLKLATTSGYSFANAIKSSFKTFSKIPSFFAKFSGIFKLFGTFGRFLGPIGLVINAFITIRNYIRDVKRLFDESGSWGEKIIKGLLLIPKAIIEAFLPFDIVKEKLDEWFFGKSPSKAGKLIMKGFSSIGPELQDSLIKPIDNVYSEIGRMSPPEINLENTTTNKLAEKSDSALISVIKLSNQQLVSKIDQLMDMMVNGGIAVNLDGQLVSRQLSTTAYRSGGFGQSTTRS